MKEADKLDPIAKSCVVALDYSERVNFAFQQNSIPVLRRLEIQNETENDWYQVSCRIKPKPEWGEAHKIQVSHIPAGTSYILDDVPLTLDLEYLANLSERVRGEMRLEISVSEAASSDEAAPEQKCIYDKSYPVDVYANDEWTGIRGFAEILAAFVTPNLEVVEQLLSNAAQFLGKRTGSSALDGYQAKSKKRVYEIVDAIYEAVREQAISYSNPAASFEKTGQLIRPLPLQRNEGGVDVQKARS